MLSQDGILKAYQEQVQLARAKLQTKSCIDGPVGQQHFDTSSGAPIINNQRLVTSQKEHENRFERDQSVNYDGDGQSNFTFVLSNPTQGIITDC